MSCGAVDDVVVGEDVAIGLHDYAGAERVLHLGLGLLGGAAAEELAKEGIVDRRELLCCAHAAGGTDSVTTAGATTLTMLA